MSDALVYVRLQLRIPERVVEGMGVNVTDGDLLDELKWEGATHRIREAVLDDPVTYLGYADPMEPSDVEVDI